MGLNVTLTDAAAKYGLDLEDAAGFTPLLGHPSSVESNAGSGPVLVNAPYILTVNTDTGYRVNAGFVVNPGGTGSITSYQTTKISTGEVLLNSVGSTALTVAQLNNLTANNLFLGNDVLNGNAANNVLAGYAGNDTINGGAGTDTAAYILPRSFYTVTRTSGGFTVTGFEGTDTLVSIERIKFSDQTVAYDTAGSAGEAYRLYQAAFNRTPDPSGLGFWTHSMDQGVSLHDVAQNFINSAEFSVRYGALNSTQFVTQLYANVLHRAPDATGLAFHVSSLNAGAARADVLGTFSESPENQAALIGTISNGMVYTG